MISDRNSLLENDSISPERVNQSLVILKEGISESFKSKLLEMAKVFPDKINTFNDYFSHKFP